MNTTYTVAMRPLLFPGDQQVWYESSGRWATPPTAARTSARWSPPRDASAAACTTAGYEQWAATAARVEAEARGQLAAGHQVSGRDGLLRAATYWRSAEFFTWDRDPDPRGRAAYEASVGCFADAAAPMSPAVTPVTIPFEGTP